MLILVADDTVTSSSLTDAGSDTGAMSSKEISSLPSSHRMSAYRSKYLHEKEQQQEELSTVPSKDATSFATADVKNGKIKQKLNVVVVVVIYFAEMLRYTFPFIVLMLSV